MKLFLRHQIHMNNSIWSCPLQLITYIFGLLVCLAFYYGSIISYTSSLWNWCLAPICNTVETLKNGKYEMRWMFFILLKQTNLLPVKFRKHKILFIITMLCLNLSLPLVLVVYLLSIVHMDGKPSAWVVVGGLLIIVFKRPLLFSFSLLCSTKLAFSNPYNPLHYLPQIV